ncbi:hypothetical protein RR48_08519 [Papilio machaon]|uniref:Uncharacterized protein n=1 Tax=Papilio machaon TaxID=76193 RepID=A0A194RHM8_PAPMA|nr:hypothetical protein RR48_08519 [Papilio machaon]
MFLAWGPIQVFLRKSMNHNFSFFFFHHRWRHLLQGGGHVYASLVTSFRDHIRTSYSPARNDVDALRPLRGATTSNT